MGFELPSTDSMLHLPRPTGRSAVGCVDIFTKEKSAKLPLLYRLYYPTSEKEDMNRWPSWFPHSRYSESYMSTFATPRFFQSSLGGIFNWLSGNPRIPANEGSKPLEERLPVVIFSHGLVGCRTTYSYLCADIASQGYYVAALEHGDNSACLRMMLDSPDGEVTWREREILPEGAPEGDLRARQLEYRTREVSQCLDSLHQLDMGQHQDHFIWNTNSDENVENTGLAGFQGKIGTEESIVSGHSMGGATTVRTLNQDNRFTGGVALDSWMFPLKEEEVNFAKEKLLFVNFERFQNNKNLTTMQRFATEPEIEGVASNVISLKNAAHYSCTDILVIFQSTILGRLVLGKQEDKFDSYARLLTSSQLFNGWVKHHLSNETSHFHSALQASQDNIFHGIKFKEN